MAFALVGAVGAATTGTTGNAVTPAWDAGASRTADNLLLLFVSGYGSAVSGPTISGWTRFGANGTSTLALVYYKVAAGGDAAPTVTATAGEAWTAHLEEWSGNDAASPLDRSGVAGGSSSPITATLAAANAAVNELVAMVGTDVRSVARATNDTWTSNHGTPTLRASNNGTSSVNHYSHATLISNSSAAADTAVMTLSITTNITGLATAAISFKLAPSVVTQTGSFTVNAVIRGSKAGSFTVDAEKASGAGPSVTWGLWSDTWQNTISAGNTIASSFTANAVIRKPGQGGSFTVDALVKRTFPGSFTADATIRRSQVGSFTANAVTKDTETGSFTLNAVVRRPGQPGSLTLDAVLRRPGQSGSFTLNAVLIRSMTGAFAISALLKRSQTGSFTANATVRATDFNSTTVDAVIRRSQASSFTVAAVVRVTDLNSFTADAIVKRSQVGSFTLNAVVRRPAAGSFTTDALIKRATTSSFTADAIVRRTGAGTFTVNAWLNKTVPGSFTVAAVIRRAGAGSFLLDAQILGVTGRTGSFGINAVIRKPGNLGSFTVDAIRLRTFPGSFTANAILKVVDLNTTTLDAVIRRPGQAGSFVVDAVVRRSAAGSFALDAVVRRSAAGTFTLDAIQRRAGAGSFTLNAWLNRKVSSSFTASAVIRATQTTGFSIDAQILGLFGRSGSFGIDAVIRRPGMPGSFTVNAVLLRHIAPSTFTANAWLNKKVSSSLAVDAVIRRNMAGSFLVDAWLNKKVSSGFTVDAIVKSTRSGSSTIDAAIRRTASGSFTADALLLRVGLSGSFAVNAVLRRPATGSLTLDAIIKGARSGSLTLDAIRLRTFVFGAAGSPGPAIRQEAKGTGSATLGLSPVTGNLVVAAWEQPDNNVASVPAGFTQIDTGPDGYYRAHGSFGGLGRLGYRWTQAGDSATVSTNGNASIVIAEVANLTTGSSPAAQAFARSQNSTVISLTSGTPGSYSFIVGGLATRLNGGTVTPDVGVFRLPSDGALPPTSVGHDRAAILWRSSAAAATLSANQAGTTQDGYWWGMQIAAFAAPAPAPAVDGPGPTLDAVIKRSTSGSFTANALVRRTGTSSLTVDAAIRKGGAGSFTLNAVIRRTGAGSFTVSAIARRPAAGTFTVNAEIGSGATLIFRDDFNRTTTPAQQLGPPWHWIPYDSRSGDVEQVKAYTDGRLVLPNQPGDWYDSYVGFPLPDRGEALFDFWVPAAVTQDGRPTYALTLDTYNYTGIYVRAMPSGWLLTQFGSDTPFAFTPTPSSMYRVHARWDGTTVFAKVWKVGDAEPAWQYSQPQEFEAWGDPQEVPPFLDLYYFPSEEDGYVDNLEIWTADPSWHGFGAFTIQAEVRILGGSFTLDAVILKTQTNQLGSGIRLDAQISGGFTVDAWISLGRKFWVDAVIRVDGGQQGVFLLEARISRQFFTLNAQIRRAGSFTLAAVIRRPGAAGSFTLNAWKFAGTWQKGFSLDALIKGRPTGRWYTNAEIRLPHVARAGDFDLDANLLAHAADSFTLEALVFDGKWAKSFALDADIKGLHEKRGTFTLAAVVRLPVEAVFLLEAEVGGRGYFRVSAYIRPYFWIDAEIVAAAPRMTGSFKVDARITNGREFTLNALVNGHRGGAFGIGALVWKPGLQDGRYFWLDAETQRHQSGSFTLAARIAGGFTINAFIRPYFTLNAYIRGNNYILWPADGGPAEDPDGVELPPWYKASRKYRIKITVGGVDVTGDTRWSATTFTQNAKTNPGTFELVLYGSWPFDGGEIVLVELDDFRTFGGYVLQVERGYVFTSKADVIVTTLRGADFNILFDKLITYNRSSADDPSGAYSPYKAFAKGSLDTRIIRKVFDSYIDKPAGLEYKTYVVTAGVAAPEKPWAMPTSGAPLRQVMQSLSQVTNAVWWIDPYMHLHYGPRTVVTAPYPITDGLGGISSANLSMTEDMSMLVTDGFLWGVLAYDVDGEIVMSRRKSTMYPDVGPFQYGEFRSDLHHQTFINRRLASVIERYGLPIKKAKAVIFEPGYQAGQVADVRLTEHGLTGILVIQSMTLSFAVMKEPRDGWWYGVPRFELSIGLDPESPWDIYDYLPFKGGDNNDPLGWGRDETGKKKCIDDNGGPGGSPGGCSAEICAGAAVDDTFSRVVPVGWGTTSEGGLPWLDMWEAVETYVETDTTPSGTFSVDGSRGIMAYTDDLNVSNDPTRILRFDDGIPYPINVYFESQGIGPTYGEPDNYVNLQMYVGHYPYFDFDSWLTVASYYDHSSHWFYFTSRSQAGLNWNYVEDVSEVILVGDLAAVWCWRIQYDEVGARAKKWIKGTTEPDWQLRLSWIGVPPPKTHFRVFDWETQMYQFPGPTPQPRIAIDNVTIDGPDRCDEVQFDNFRREVTSGWGASTPSGYAWQSLSTSSTQKSVNGSRGVMTYSAFPANDANRHQDAYAVGGPWTSPTTSDAILAFEIEGVETTNVSTLTVQYISGSNASGGQVVLRISSVNGSAGSTGGPTVVKNDWVAGKYLLRLRRDPVARTLLSRVWLAGTPEPSTWLTSGASSVGVLDPQSWFMISWDRGGVNGSLDGGPARSISFSSIDFDYEGRPCYYEQDCTSGCGSTVDSFARSITASTTGTLGTGPLGTWGRWGADTVGVPMDVGVNGSAGSFTFVSGTSPALGRHAYSYLPVRAWPTTLEFLVDAHRSSFTNNRVIVYLMTGDNTDFGEWLSFETSGGAGGIAISSVGWSTTDDGASDNSFPDPARGMATGTQDHRARFQVDSSGMRARTWPAGVMAEPEVWDAELAFNPEVSAEIARVLRSGDARLVMEVWAHSTGATFVDQLEIIEGGDTVPVGPAPSLPDPEGPGGPCEDVDGEQFGAVTQGWGCERLPVVGGVVELTGTAARSTLTLYDATTGEHIADGWFEDQAGKTFRVPDGITEITACYRNYTPELGNNPSVPRLTEGTVGRNHPM